MPPRKQGGERHFNLKPTMGKSAEEHRLLLNVVSRDGVMERRPAIRAVDIGYSTETRTTVPGSGNGADISGYTKAFSLTAENKIIEGIDVELVAGKVLALYIYNGGLDAALNIKGQMAFSWHHPEDPMIGAGAGGSIVTSSGMGKATSATPSTNFASARYTAAQWWNRRIIRALDGFIITG